MKRNLIIFLSIFSSFFLSVMIYIAVTIPKEVIIYLDSNYNEFFSMDEINKKKHVSINKDFFSDVSIAYNNLDGTKTLYVFASPIAYVNESGVFSYFDTRICNVENKELRNEGYNYTIKNCDIKSYFPCKLSKKLGIRIDKKISLKFGPENNKKTTAKYKSLNNFIGEEKNMLVYEDAFIGKDLKVYPTSCGVNCEITYKKNDKDNKITFWMDIPYPDIHLRVEPGGYLILYKNEINSEGILQEEILGVIQKPLIKNLEGKISYNNNLSFKQTEKNKYELTFVIDNNFVKSGSTAFISFEMRREKQPDNCLYSNFPNLQYAYLNNYSVIGNSKEYGNGRLMIRFKIIDTFKLYSSNIIESYYYTYNLNMPSIEKQYNLYTVLEDWCSLTGNWNKNYKVGDITSQINTKDNELCFNITNELRKWCDDETRGLLEHYGVQLRSSESPNDYSIILSNDNTLYRNRTEIILK